MDMIKRILAGFLVVLVPSLRRAASSPASHCPSAPHLHLRDVASAKPAAGPALLLASNCTETMAPTCFTRHNRTIRHRRPT